MDGPGDGFRKRLAGQLPPAIRFFQIIVTACANPSRGLTLFLHFHMIFYMHGIALRRYIVILFNGDRPPCLDMAVGNTGSTPIPREREACFPPDE
jgi:hypothetical protein